MSDTTEAYEMIGRLKEAIQAIYDEAHAQDRSWAEVIELAEDALDQFED